MYDLTMKSTVATYQMSAPLKGVKRSPIQFESLLDINCDIVAMAVKTLYNNSILLFPF